MARAARTGDWPEARPPRPPVAAPGGRAAAGADPGAGEGGGAGPARRTPASPAEASAGNRMAQRRAQRAFGDAQARGGEGAGRTGGRDDPRHDPSLLARRPARGIARPCSRRRSPRAPGTPDLVLSPFGVAAADVRRHLAGRLPRPRTMTVPLGVPCPCPTRPPCRPAYHRPGPTPWCSARSSRASTTPSSSTSGMAGPRRRRPLVGTPRLGEPEVMARLDRRARGRDRGRGLPDGAVAALLAGPRRSSCRRAPRASGCRRWRPRRWARRRLWRPRHLPRDARGSGDCLPSFDV